MGHYQKTEPCILPLAEKVSNDFYGCPVHNKRPQAGEIEKHPKKTV